MSIKWLIWLNLLSFCNPKGDTRIPAGHWHSTLWNSSFFLWRFSTRTPCILPLQYGLECLYFSLFFQKWKQRFLGWGLKGNKLHFVLAWNTKFWGYLTFWRMFPVLTVVRDMMWLEMIEGSIRTSHMMLPSSQQTELAFPGGLPLQVL